MCPFTLRGVPNFMYVHNIADRYYITSCWILRMLKRIFVFFLRFFDVFYKNFRSAQVRVGPIFVKKRSFLIVLKVRFSSQKAFLLFATCVFENLEKIDFFVKTSLYRLKTAFFEFPEKNTTLPAWKFLL